MGGSGDGGEPLLYDEQHVEFLETLWGEGYLSPGGPEELRAVLAGVSLHGRRVLDVGSGSGGVTVALVQEHGAARVLGLDVESDVCRAARARVAAAGLDAGTVEIRQVRPGPWPLDDASFDVVFSKDSIVHVPDKEALAREAWRVLRPGGVFVASDWMMSHDGEPSAEMRAYLELEDLDFGMASPQRYRRALEAAGFTRVALRDRSAWYAGEARREVARLSGPERPRFERILGADAIATQIKTWHAMITVLDTGEHCPHHFCAWKPTEEEAAEAEAATHSNDD